MYVGGRSLSGGDVGSGGVRNTCSGGSGQSSSGSSSRIHGSSVGLVPCLNQSWIMNCSHEAINALPAVAGISSSRVISRRLTVRGLGSSMRSVSGQVCSIGTLRPKRVPAIPIVGLARSFQLPSTVRCFSKAGSHSGASTAPTDGWREVSKRLCSRRTLRMPTRSKSPISLGRWSQPSLWSTRVAKASYACQRKLRWYGLSALLGCVGPGSVIATLLVSHESGDPSGRHRYPERDCFPTRPERLGTNEFQYVSTREPV